MINDKNIDQEVSLKTVLENTGLALATMATMADALDELVGDLVFNGSNSNPSTADTDSLQRVDLLRQSIHATAILIGNLADMQSSDQNISLTHAGDRVNLQWIRETCLPTHKPAEHNRAVS